MNRSGCRVMVGVAGLAVLGMTATLASEPTDEGKAAAVQVRVARFAELPSDTCSNRAVSAAVFDNGQAGDAGLVIGYDPKAVDRLEK